MQTDTLSARAQIERTLDPSALPDRYAMSVAGACMAPAIPDGSKIKVSKSDPYQIGDIVCVWFQPHVIRPGGPPAFIKRLAMAPPPWVTFPYKDHPESEVLAMLFLSMDDTPGRMLRMRCADVLAIHKVLGVAAEGETRPATAADYLRCEVGSTRRASGRIAGRLRTLRARETEMAVRL